MRDETITAVTDAAGVKIGAAVTGLGAILAWDAPLLILGVPVAVLLASLTGALLGILYGKPLESRKVALGHVVVNSFLASVCTAIAPHVPLFGWLKAAPLGAVALVLAFAARWAVPALVEHLPAVVSRYMGRLFAKGS